MGTGGVADKQRKNANKWDHVMNDVGLVADVIYNRINTISNMVILYRIIHILLLQYYQHHNSRESSVSCLAEKTR